MDDEAIRIERVESIDEAMTAHLRRLIAQLSTSEPPDIDHLRQVIANPNTFLFCAFEESGDIVGTLSLVTFHIPTGTRAWIEDVVVDTALRGRGIATQLIDAALRTAKERGAKTVDLTSRAAREQANRLYEAVGFSRRETNVWRHIPHPK